jgi:hypothetical protein
MKEGRGISVLRKVLGKHAWFRASPWKLKRSVLRESRWPLQERRYSVSSQLPIFAVSASFKKGAEP